MPTLTRAFIDTNILVYSITSSESAKQDQALTLLRELFQSGRGVISTQVLNEFCNVAYKKHGLNRSEIHEQLALYEAFDVVTVTPAIVLQAVDLRFTRSISYYDALIVASAITAGCTTVYSEDMNNGERIDQIQLINPFTSLPGA